MRIYPDQLAERTAVLCVTYLRQHAGYATDSVTGLPIVDFSPVLTAPEQATYADILALARSGYDLTLAEYQAIKPQLTTGRAFLGLSQSQFMALTAAERDRMIFDNMSATWRVIFRLLRE